MIASGVGMRESVCFTGKLNNMTRNEARSLALQHGFTIAEGVSTFCDILVVADPNSNSTKLRKARALGIKCISENEFLEMCNQDVKKVEAETEWKKAHPVKQDLTWQRLCRMICKKCGLTCSSDSISRYGLKGETHNYQACIKICCFDGYWRQLCYSDNADEDTGSYKALSREEAFKLVLVSFFKHVNCVWGNDQTVKDFYATIPTLSEGFESPEELKLKLEVMGWSIIED